LEGELRALRVILGSEIAVRIRALSPLGVIFRGRPLRGLLISVELPLLA